MICLIEQTKGYLLYKQLVAMVYGLMVIGLKKSPLGLFGLQLINCETEKEVPLRANYDTR